MSRKKPPATSATTAHPAIDDTFEVEMWPVEKPVDYPTNPKHHTEEAIDRLAAIIARVGMQVAIVVDEHGVIAKGHKTRAACRRLGFTRVPIKVARGVSPEELRAWRVADEAATLDSLWDEGNLGVELEAIREAGVPLSHTGLDEDEIERILGEESPRIEPVGVRPLPAMTWVLIGIPTVQYDDISDLVARAADNPEAIVEVTANDKRERV
jgi:hypothetical protein